MMLSEGRAGIDSVYSLKDGRHQRDVATPTCLRRMNLPVTKICRVMAQVSCDSNYQKICTNEPDSSVGRSAISDANTSRQDTASAPRSYV